MAIYFIYEVNHTIWSTVLSLSHILRDYEPLDVPLFQALYVILFPHSLAQMNLNGDMIGLFSVNSHRTQLLSERYFICAVYIGLVWDTIVWVLLNESSMSNVWRQQDPSTTIWQFNLASWD